MRVLVTGISGILGQYLARTRSKEVWLTGVSRAEPKRVSEDFDIVHCSKLDKKSLASLISKIRPDVLIHAAAEGSVDAVEKDPEEYRKINEVLPGELASLTRKNSIQYVYISSNAVYGNQNSPWTEDSPQFPVNKYGEAKRRAEVGVADANEDALIVRPIMMYGWPAKARRENPVSFWIKQLETGRSVSVVNDVWTQPLYAGDCAQAIWAAVKGEVNESLNISGGVTLSLFEFALLTAKTFELKAENISEISSGELAALAPRPSLTEFDLSRLMTIMPTMPLDPIAGLSAMKSCLHTDGS
jgi:dTDP-4-dehydrorhamnose reductase